MFSMLTTLLTGRLINELSWNQARLACLSILLVSILRNRTVNLVKLASEANDEIKEGSLYRRFQNFFLKFDMPIDDIGRLVLAKLSKPVDGWVLSMDRTNWKFGRTHINILVIGVVTRKVAIPVCWVVLPPLISRSVLSEGRRVGWGPSNYIPIYKYIQYIQKKYIELYVYINTSNLHETSRRDG